MAIENRDYLLRQIERLAEAVAAALGGVSSVEMIEAARECERVKATLLGPLRDGFDRLTPESAVMLLGGAAKARLVARVLELQADLRERQSEDRAAATDRRQALAILDAVARKDPRAVDDAHRARVAALEAKLPR
jgi:phage gp29-like protein